MSAGEHGGANRSDAKPGARAGHKAFTAVGVVAAGVATVMLNALVARFYTRWDVTTDRLYTLSGATVERLRALDEPVDVIVLLSRSDNLQNSVRQMLAAYGAETTKLRVRYVDPDRDPAEFLALEQKFGLHAGKTEDGRVVSDASIVVTRGDKRWFITSDDLVAYDEKDQRVRPKLEQALTEGIANVLTSERAKLCFTTGHQEMSLDDAGPSGLAELRTRLEKNNYEIAPVDTVKPTTGPRYAGCRAVVIAGPESAFDGKSAGELAEVVRNGTSALILANPILDDDNRIRPTGLEPVTRLGGIEMGDDFVVERDPSARLPSGLGETFFAILRRHDITRGLVKEDGAAAYGVLMSAAQSLRASATGTPAPLLVTSDQAFSVKDIRPFTEEGKAVEPTASDPRGPFTVAMAAELPKPEASRASHGPRLVVVGSANVAWGRNWRDSTLLGDALFMESALSWLSARPTLVSVPEKASHDAGLSLSEESLSDVRWYVLVYMPLTALALGGFVMLRRRRAEKKSREDKA